MMHPQTSELLSASITTAIEASASRASTSADQGVLFLPGNTDEKVTVSAVNNLLNCFLREYHLPSCRVDIQEKKNVISRNYLERNMAIDFHLIGIRLNIPVAYVSVLGRCHFIGRPKIKEKATEAGWQTIDAKMLLRVLSQYLEHALGQPVNPDLYEQLSNSIQSTTYFLDHQREPSLNPFIASEQSLVFGHQLHPTPKSRHGVLKNALLHCSPEVKASFHLHWFRVHVDHIKVVGVEPRSPHQIFGDYLDDAEGSDPAYIDYPCHPWEVDIILNNPGVRALIDEEKLLYLGEKGKPMYPTSSVRTLYSDSAHCFMKFSVSVRLTNCVRKNAYYELETAVYLSNLIKQHSQEKSIDYPGFLILFEPVATVITPNKTDKNTPIEAGNAIESLGIIFRESFSSETIKKYQPQVAAALFGFDASGGNVIAKRLRSMAELTKASYEDVAERWFKRYVECLLPGVIGYFFEHGVIFEAHLQNVLIGFDNGLPVSVWIRDLEGVKLIPERWRCDELSDVARASVYYSQQKGWQRIAYTLLVNNLSEAIFFMADGHVDIELRLWEIVQHSLVNYQHQYGIKAEIETILSGGRLPAKRNLMTRLLAKADKDADYGEVPSPWSPSLPLICIQ